ncbi:MAG: TIGR01777 family protein [Anaerolineae bacterium]|nr:TIGR01777 family protein [Anaerolineae bacterium]
MRIILAGGSGLIGQALTESLLADEHDVGIISRNPNTADNIPVNVKVFGWQANDLIEGLEGVDVLINFAGASIAGDSPLQMRWTAKRKKQIAESRIIAGNKLSEAIKTLSKKPRLLIQSSAVGFYGPLGDELVDENYPAGKDFLAGVCQNWEESTREVESMGIRRVIVRTGLVFSKLGGIFPLLKLPFTLFVGGRIGDGQQYLPWIHIDDFVNAIKFLIDDEKSAGIYNFSSPNPVNNATFAQLLGKAIERPSIIPVPALVIKLALGEAATLALDGQRAVPQRLLESGYNFNYKFCTDALDSLK